jgi:hypothetical protein
MRALARFRDDERGVGTVLALYGLIGSLILVGLAIDTANAWRTREQLQVAADAAAHAGAVALARGADPEGARAATLAATEMNLPAALHGRVIGDPYEDVRPLHYDAGTNRLGAGGEVNAVSILVQRSRATGNPVGTLLLKLAGHPYWDMAAGSVAAVVPTRRCNPAEGAYARGTVTLGGEAAVGAGYCLHGQDAVEIGGTTGFAPGSGLSMRDLAACSGRCGNLTNPGIEGAMAEANLLTPDTAAHIRRLAEGFTDPNRQIAEAGEFFRTRPRAYDLEPLAEVGVYTRPLRTGDVVRLTPMKVGRMRGFPAGLVYHVPCGAGEERLELSGYGMGLELRDMVLVTDCALEIEGTVTLTGALLISTAEAPMLAAPGALAGDPEGKCAPGSRAQVFTLAPMRITATLAAANATFVSAGDIVVEGRGDGAATAHAGTAFHAAGDIRFDARHAFTACGDEAPSTVPALKVIRQVSATRAVEM